MMKTIINSKWFTTGILVSSLLMAGCTELQFPAQEYPESADGKIVLEIDQSREVVVKSAASESESAINNVYIIHFKNDVIMEDGLIGPITAQATEQTGIYTLDAVLDRTADEIYFIANTNNNTINFREGKSKTDVISTLTWDVAEPQDSNKGDTDPTTDTGLITSGFPMIGHMAGNSSSLTVKMEKAIVKLQFTLNTDIPAGQEFAVHSIEIMNVPETIQYFQPDTPTTYPNTESTNFYGIETGTSEGDGYIIKAFVKEGVPEWNVNFKPSVPIDGTDDANKKTDYRDYTGKVLDATGITETWYLPENVRGTGNATTQWEKNDNLPATGGNYATYVRIKGYYLSDGLIHAVTYYVYLGENNINDFNIRRNTVYKVTATIRGLRRIDTRINDLTPQNYIDYTDNSTPWFVIAYSDYGSTFNWDQELSCPSGWHVPTKEEMMLTWIYEGLDENENVNLGEYKWTTQIITGQGRWSVNLSSGQTLFVTPNSGGSATTSRLRCVKDLL